ncbi:hypothetical protein [Emticicia sp. C21]|uniref:hypothetical protein n=1 Tax=Emticicia sp. C21 TaxID=2302915 RepID=UPI000E3577D0|nr:hypothetical protein [Emticicia sp. C21]RFS16409.1 hypothetical protein D0T08_12040 [Emticicia sp. C21]
MKAKFYIGLSIVLLLSIQLKAQEENKASQIKNNRLPGGVYASPKVSNTAPSKGFEGSSLAKAYREGKVEGLKFIFSPLTTTNSVTNNAIKPQGLASEMSSGEAKSAYDKAVKEAQTNAAPPNLPNLTQEAKKE